MGDFGGCDSLLDRYSIKSRSIVVARQIRPRANDLVERCKSDSCARVDGRGQFPGIFRIEFIFAITYKLTILNGGSYLVFGDKDREYFVVGNNGRV